MFSLIRTVIQWGLFLGVCGGLTDVVRAMAFRAAQAQPQFVSLGKLSRALNGVTKNHSK